MEKPKITGQLAFIAMLFVCANFLLNVIVILFPELYIELFAGIEPELSMQLQAILLAEAACVLPLGGICLWSKQQSEISENMAAGILILSGLFYFAPVLISSLLRFLAVRMAVGAEERAVFSIINSARSIFSFCMVAALVLICCSASIELYLAKNLTSEALKEEQP